jgi:hypothetical protein
MSVFTVVYPFHYTVTADTFNNAIKHFVKSHRDMNINHLIIKDQQRHMEARIKKFWKDGRNFLGLNVYPVENPFTGQIQYLGDNPMRGGDDEAVEDSENFEEFADLELSDEKEMTGGMMSMYPYQGFMGSAAIPAVGYNQPTIGVAPVASGIAPQGVTQLTTTPPLSPVNLTTFAQTGTNVAATAAGSTVVSPTFSQVNTGNTVLPPMISPYMGGVAPMLSPAMGGLGPMITTKNKFKGAPITPATSVFPTYDQNGKRHMTIAMSPTKSGFIAPAGGTTIASGAPFVAGIPGSGVMAPMGGVIAPVGLASTSLTNRAPMSVTGQVNLTSPTAPAGAPAGTTPAGTTPAGAPAGTTPAGAPAGAPAGTPPTGTTPGAAPTPGTYNFTATINLNPSVQGVNVQTPTPVQIDLTSNVPQQILNIMQQAVNQFKTTYAGKNDALIVLNNIQVIINNNNTTNPPNTALGSQGLITSFSDEINRLRTANAPQDVIDVCNQLAAILSQLQQSVQNVNNGQTNPYNPGTAAYAGSYVPAGTLMSPYGVPLFVRQKNSWSPKINKKEN